jgi:hypothetical protein
MPCLPTGEIKAVKFQPKSETEIAEAGNFPAGVYDFEVSAAKDTFSKAGNDMIELQVTVHDNEGRSRKIFDYLVHTDGSAYKVRNFAIAVGMLAEYERGEMLAEDMMGRTGKCRVFIKKDKDKQYPDKNAIGDYLKPLAA